MLVKLASAVVSTALAAGLLARDHGLTVNRLIAVFLACNAYWSLCGFFLPQVTDAEAAHALMRWMSLGWIPLGVLCAHVSVRLSVMENRAAARRLRVWHVAVATMLPIAIGTDWVIAGVVPGGAGWQPVYGPGMTVAYFLLAAPLVGVLSRWRGLLAMADAVGQRMLARIVFFGVTGALLCGTLTSVVLPTLGIASIGVTSQLLTAVGIAVAWTLRRYGHSMIAPEAFAREVLDTLGDGLILVDAEGRLRDANRAFLRMIGEPQWLALGRPAGEWIDPLPPGSAARDGAVLGELRRRTGRAVPIVVSAPVPCRGAGRLVGHAYVIRDRREIVALRRQLIVSARLAAVGDLSKSIAAAIQEPIAAARDELFGLDLDWQTLGFAIELAGATRACEEALEEGRELVDECVEGVERIYAIVREVAGFSRDGAEDAVAPHDLARIVERAIRVAEVQAPEDLVIEARLDPGVEVVCHESEIERVVTNLLVNAIHALRGKERGARHLVVAVVGQGRRALLHVEDDGCGIEPDTLERIFDPFFTTKPVGDGTGLGLSISYHTVRAHGGEIRVSSVADRGTSVAVELPRAAPTRPEALRPA